MTADDGDACAGSEPGDPPADAPLSAVLPIVNEKGLHARASAKFATLAETFDAKVIVTREGLSVNAASLMGLLMLAASKGSEIALEASGRQAAEALEALSRLVADRFGEPS